MNTSKLLYSTRTDYSIQRYWGRWAVCHPTKGIIDTFSHKTLAENFLRTQEKDSDSKS